MSARPVPLQALMAGALAALVGFGSSFAVVIQGLAAVGADTAQIASALFALCLGMGGLAVWLSFRWRMPVSIAWTTPGAALLASTGAVPGGFEAAVGAFMLAGALIVLCGLWRPLGRWITAIPPALANAMLAGVLLKLCLAPFMALGVIPGQALVVLGVYVALSRFARLYAVPGAVLAALVLLVLGPDAGLAGNLALPQPLAIRPVFTWDAAVGIALPLFIVTMASQNIPGLAILSVYGYRPQAGPIFRATGLASMALAPLGALSCNLAAITAALVASPEAHPDAGRRYLAAVSAGFTYVLLALVAGIAATVVTASPPLLIQAVAGLALLGSLGSSIVNGLQDESSRPAAILTFLLTASGLSLWGIGSAFWGLLAGLVVHALYRWPARRAA
jgi:benzoate membrane transport protein